MEILILKSLQQKFLRMAKDEQLATEILMN